MDNTNNGTNPQTPVEPMPAQDPAAGSNLGWTPPAPEPAAPAADPAMPASDPMQAPGGAPVSQPTNSWTPEPSTPAQPVDPISPVDPAVGGEQQPAAPVDNGTGTNQPAM